MREPNQTSPQIMPNHYLVSAGDAEYNVSEDHLAAVDLTPTESGHYHLLKDGKAYHCELLTHSADQKRMTVKINGRTHEVSIADQYDQLVKQLGLSVVAAQKSSDVFAPMPGLVLSILVQEGDEITEGTPLLILEAMKMENVIKAEGAGNITRIAVKQGDAVEKRQLLIEVA